MEPLGGRQTRKAARDYDLRLPLHLSVLTPEAVRAALARDARLLVPVGTCEQHGPHLPLGCDTYIVERLADDLSSSFSILRAPTIPYGVNTVTKRPYPGNATVRRKTLHRWMNDLLWSWEQCGVDAFIILTAHGHDPADGAAGRALPAARGWFRACHVSRLHRPADPGLGRKGRAPV